MTDLPAIITPICKEEPFVSPERGSGVKQQQLQNCYHDNNGKDFKYHFLNLEQMDKEGL